MERGPRGAPRRGAGGQEDMITDVAYALSQQKKG